MACASLEDYVSTCNVYLSKDEYLARDAVLRELEQISQNWVQSILKQKTAQKNVESCGGATIKAFGSHFTKTATKDGDIDAVLLVPETITYQDFFDSLQPILKESEHVTQLREVRQARVPLINLIYKAVYIDLLMCVVPLPEVPGDLDRIFELDVLQKMTDASRIGINGLRESTALLELVPNQDVFIHSVKAIKLWAKVHGLSHGGLGLLGGIAWTIMAARVCQMYPQADLETIVKHFFKHYSQWSWPSPVRLKEAEEDVLDLKPWNSKISTTDRLHPMPIITPVYPEQNTAFTVTDSGMKIITQAISLGNQITERIASGKAGWDALYMPAQFITQYRHYLVVTCVSKDAKSQLDWCGLVEAKIRLLILSLEKNKDIDYIHPHPKSYPTREECGSMWLLGLQLSCQQNITLNLGKDIHQWTKLVYENSTSREFDPKNVKITVNHTKRKQLLQLLPAELSENYSQ